MGELIATRHFEESPITIDRADETIEISLQALVDMDRECVCVDVVEIRIRGRNGIVCYGIMDYDARRGVLKCVRLWDTLEVEV